jgi:hypothetical protein
LRIALGTHILLAAMMKRIAIYVLALAVVLGTTLQVIPRADATSPQPDMAMQMAGMSDMGGCQQPAHPCKEPTSACIDVMSCAINLAVPMTPSSIPVSFRWASVSYSLAIAPIAGVSTEPELFPPILRV